MADTLRRHRGFILGLLFLILNGFTSCMVLTGRVPLGGPRAELLAPKDGLLSGRDAAIWRFTADMVPHSATRKWIDAPFVVFTPAVAGRCLWRTPNELLFEPREPWPACTAFEAALTAQLPSLGLLSSRHTRFHLRTAPLAFLAASQAEYRPNGEASILLKFSDAVIPLELLHFLFISDPDGRPVNAHLESASNAAQIPIRLAGLSTNEVTVRVKAGLRGLSGPLGIERDETFRVAFRADLAIEHVAPRLRSLGRGYVDIAVNSPLDLATAASFVAVDPPLAVSLNESWNGHYRLEGDFRAGSSYRIAFRRGLRSRAGQFLGEDVTRAVYFPDAGLDVQFTTGGRYMTPGGAMRLPFETVNARTCKALVERVYPNNLVYLARRPRHEYYWRSPATGLSRVIAESEFPIQSRRNDPTPGQIDLASLIGARRGAFRVVIEARNEQDQSDSADRLVVLSDIGITLASARDDLLVWANSIHTLAPLSNAQVRVYSAENQELLAGRTDEGGLLRLAFASREWESKPSVVTVQHGDDLTFLALGEAAAGRASPAGSRAYLRDGYEACVFTERGIYRPGESARVKAILRGKEWSCPEPFPVELTVTRADAVVQKKVTQLLNAFGTAEFEIPFPDYWRTGKYELSVALPGSPAVLGGTTVSVEEFLPPQIRVSVKLSPAASAPTNDLHALLASEYFFGQPAAGLVAEMFVEYHPRPFAPAQWPDYAFGNPQRAFKPVEEKLGKKILSPTGKAEYRLAVSPRWRPPARLAACAAGVVTEISGRAVTAYASHTLDPYPFYLGIKQDASLPRASQPVAFRLVAVRPDGLVHPLDRPLELRIERIAWATALRRETDGRLSWRSEQQIVPLSTNAVLLAAGKGVFQFTPPGPGDYRLTVSDPAGDSSSALDFHAGDERQHGSERSIENPDVVQMDLDKPSYRPGETAVLKAVSPFPGKALLTLESTHILSARVIDLTNNTIQVSIPVEAAYAPNVYASLTVIRPVQPEKIWTPHRARGCVSLNVERPDRRLNVALAAPSETRPRQKLGVDVRVTAPGGDPASAEVVVAAVDESICTLTRFRTPDPYGFFFAPRRAEVAFHDLYGELVPEIEHQVLGTPSAPGGDLIPSLLNRLNPVKARRFKSLALWSSTLFTDSNGCAHVEMDLPEFSGELRLMAVAVDRERLGSADQRVKVKAPLIVQSSLPRCLAPNDTFRMPVQITNETGTNGELRVALECSGPLADDSGAASIVRAMALPARACTNLDFTLRAGTVPGKAVCRLHAELAGWIYRDDIELPVRPTAPRIAVCANGSIPPGQTAVLNLPANWLAGTAQTAILCSSLPAVRLEGSLSSLVQYPYGCLEQTTSKSFPLLYLADLAEEVYPGWLSREQIRDFVQAGIQRILTMQDWRGTFALWPHGDPYPWGSIYATHFLVEAKKAGYEVPEDRLNQACESLARWLSQRTPADRVPAFGGDQTEYNASLACFVLAAGGRPQHGWAARLYEQRQHLDRGTRVNLAAALAAMRLKRDAQSLLDDPCVYAPTNTPFTIGGSLRSTVRDDAFLLAALLDFAPDNERIPELAQRLESLQTGGRWYTTHDNAMALMALGKYARFSRGQHQPIAGVVTRSRGLDSREFADPRQARIDLGSEAGGPVLLRNTGAGTLYYSCKSEGVPADGQVEEGDRRVRIQREFLGADGRAVDLLDLRQGSLVVVKWTLATGETLDNLVIEDLLPAGLEVENAGLKTSQALPWIEAQATLKPLHVDVRDDRVIAFTGPFSGAQTFFYVTRAVTRGTFRLPAIRAECMYDPAIHSTRGAGVVTVKPD